MAKNNCDVQPVFSALFFDFDHEYAWMAAIHLSLCDGGWYGRRWHERHARRQPRILFKKIVGQ